MIIKLIVLVFLGIITSIEDFKYNKIKNIWIVLGLIIGILLINVDNLSNFVISIFLGYFLWHFRLWSAGDAKLFMVYSLLIPTEFYNLGRVNYFQSFTLLFNTLIPLFLFLLFTNLNKLKSIKFEFDFIEALKLFFSIGGIYWLLLLVLRDEFVSFFLIMILMIFLKKYILKYYYVGISLFIVKNILYFSLLFLSISFVIFIAYYIIRTLIKSFGENFVKTIKINKLKKGMILAEELNIRNKKGMPMLDNFGDGLTEKEIKIIKETPLKTVKIEESMPFAFYLFVGVIITLLIKGNFVIYLLKLF